MSFGDRFALHRPKRRWPNDRQTVPKMNVGGVVSQNEEGQEKETREDKTMGGSLTFGE